MAVGQDEPVAVRPVGAGRVVAQDPGEQDVGQRGEGHGRARVARLGRPGGVDGEPADDVDPQLLELGGRASGRGGTGGGLGIGQTLPVVHRGSGYPAGRPFRSRNRAADAAKVWTKFAPPTGPNSPGGEHARRGGRGRGRRPRARASWWASSNSRVPRPLQVKSRAASARRRAREVVRSAAAVPASRTANCTVSPSGTRSSTDSAPVRPLHPEERPEEEVARARARARRRRRSGRAGGRCPRCRRCRPGRGARRSRRPCTPWPGGRRSRARGSARPG